MNRNKDSLDFIRDLGSRRNLGGKIASKILDKPSPEKMASYLRKEAGIGGIAKWVKDKPITNIVRTVKGFRHPVESFKTGVKSGWGGPLKPGQSRAGQLAGKALFIGTLPFGVGEAFSKEDPTGEGRSRPERSLRWIGRTAGGFIGLPHGIITGPFVGSAIGESVGALAGKAIGKVTGRSSTQLPFKQMAAHNPPSGPFYGQ